MTHISKFLLLYALSVSIFVFVMTTMNPLSLSLVTQSTIYATTQQQVNSSSENDVVSSEVSKGPETTKENVGSELAFDLVIPYTPGTGNAQIEGILNPPRTNPQTPIEPGYIPITLDKSANLTIIYNTTNPNTKVEVCVFTSYPSALNYFRYEVPADPYCVKASPGSSLHSVLAPGLVDTRISSASYDVDNSRCHFYIYPNESKTCFMNFKEKPSYLTTPQETIEQGGTLQIPSK